MLHFKAAPTAVFKKSNSKASIRAESSLVAFTSAKYVKDKLSTVVAVKGKVTTTSPSTPHSKTGEVALTVSFKVAIGNRVTLDADGAVVTMGATEVGDRVGNPALVGTDDIVGVETDMDGLGVGVFV